MSLQQDKLKLKSIETSCEAPSNNFSLHSRWQNLNGVLHREKPFGMFGGLNAIVRTFIALFAWRSDFVQLGLSYCCHVLAWSSR